MASWAKNQIAKQLAKFAKNVDPNQITLKFLKGEGELLNLELNEVLLSQLLEFPPWLHLRKATCNRISAKVKWTSLKTDPIRLYLDCVEVELVASDEVKEPTGHPTNVPKPGVSNSNKTAHKPNKYGFIEKVVDGMFVSINTVTASLKSFNFKASFSMSRIMVQSMRPDWQVTDNLRFTRIKDDQRGQVLNFKEIRWGTLRIDADASVAEPARSSSTPLRLITNNSAIRITIKKRIADCSLMSSRLCVILDDILWVLTQNQLLRLSSFVQYILKLRMKYLPLAPHTSDMERHAAPPPTHTMETQFQGKGQGSDLNPLFSKYDVIETSYHVTNRRIDLHLCDDQTLDGELASRRKNNGKGSKRQENGGAIQVSFMNLKIDHCPYHIAGVKRNFVRAEDEIAFTRRQWAHQLLEYFMKSQSRATSDQSSKHQTFSPSTHARKVRPLMYENFFLVSCKYFDIMQVTTAGIRQPKPFVTSDKDALYLPEDMDAIFIDYTAYYHTGTTQLPVPAPNLFVKINPIKVNFHPMTCIWLNRFAQSVVGGLEWTKEFFTREFAPADHLNIRIEALLPKIILPVEVPEDILYYDKRPKALQVQIAQAVVTNSRIGSACTQSDLLMDLQYQMTSKLYTDSFTFPNQRDDVGILPNETWTNDYSLGHRQFKNRFETLKKSKRCDQTIMTHPDTPRQIWCLWVDQLWVEFLGIADSNGRPITFVDPVPLRVWACVPISFIGAAQIHKKSENTEGNTGDLDSTLLDLSRTFTPDSVLSSTDVNTLSPAKGSAASLPQNQLHKTSPLTTRATQDSGKQINPLSEPGNPLPGSVKAERAPYEQRVGSRTSLSTGPNSPAHSINETSSYSSRDSMDRILEFDPAVVSVVDDCLALGTRKGSLAADTFNESLRHSRSETSLLPRALESKVSFGDTQSLHEFKISTSTFYDGSSEPTITGPPPPYYPGSQTLEKKTEVEMVNLDTAKRGSRRLSDASLPPAYEATVHGNGGKQEDIDPAIFSYFTSSSNRPGTHFMLEPVPVRKVPTVSVIVHIPRKTTVQLDHFQLLFLLRLGDMFQEFSESMAEFQNPPVGLRPRDSVTVLSDDSPTPSFSMYLALPELEVDIILPPVKEPDSLLYKTLLERLTEQERRAREEFAGSSENRDNTNDRTPPLTPNAFHEMKAEGGEEEAGEASNSRSLSKREEVSELNHDGETLLELAEKSVRDDVRKVVPEVEAKDLDDSSGVSSSGSSPRTCAKCHTEAHKRTCQCGRSGGASQSSAESASQSTQGETKSGNKKVRIDFEESSVHVSRENLLVLLEAPDSHEAQDPANEEHQDFCEPGSTTVETQRVAAVPSRSDTSSPEIAVDEAAECGELWQTQGSRTCGSQGGKKPLGRLCSEVNHRQLGKGELETPTSINMTENIEESSLSGAKADMEDFVSVIQIRAKNLRVAVQAEGEENVTKIGIEMVKLEEKGNVMYNRTLNHRLVFPEESDDFGDYKSEKLNGVGCDNMIAIRVEKGPKAERHAPKSADLGFADIRVSGLEATLRLSSTDQLAEFGEDEIVAYTPPFLVQLENIRLLLIDDKKRSLKSAPVPAPLQISIERLYVRRSCEGIISLSSSTGSLLSANPITIPFERLETDVSLRPAAVTSSVASMTDSLASRIDELENENERLVEDLKVSTNRMSSLEDERDSLLKVIEKLQQELMWSNKENEELHNRISMYKVGAGGSHRLGDGRARGGSSSVPKFV